jgi:thiol-disulfide isomerase/thioredoxin
LPRPAAPWSAKTLDHKTISVQQYKGKPVVVIFMLSTCEHCQKLVSVINTLQAEFAPKGAIFLGGIFDGTRTLSVADYVKRFKPSFPVGTMEESSLLSFGQYGRDKPSYYPMMFFIDRWGTLRTQYMGSEALFQGDELANIRGEVSRLVAMKPVAVAPSQPAGKK